jgi:AcrR family transcriptional regulator
MKTDRRVLRTRQLLRESLIALILEKGYDAVTIQDITDRANLGRATFYLHYKDKDELLLSMMEEIQQQVIERTAPLSAGSFLAEGKPPSLLAFQHAEENADFYRAMLGESGLAGVMSRYRQSGAARVEAQIEPLLGDASPVPVEILSNYIMGALNAMLMWWLENDRPYSAEYMASLFHQMVLNGYMGLLAAEENSKKD